MMPKRRRPNDFFDALRRWIAWNVMMPYRGGHLEGHHYGAEPFVDLIETDEEVIVTIELPGVKKEDIRITANENNLGVDIESQEKKESETESEYAYRRRYAGFHSVYKTPVEINPDAVKAAYKNGVLEVKAPKKNPGRRRRIKVE